MDIPVTSDSTFDNSGGDTHLTFFNVALAFSFVVFTTLLSTVFGLGVGRSLLTSAVRCFVQLSIIALVLDKVFAANNPWAVAGITCLLNIMGTTETVINKSKRRYHNMYLSVFAGMLGSTIPVSIIGTRYIMAVDPFWRPEQYIPVVGMLCGNTISSIVVSVTFVIKEVYENKDKVETYLAFGATRFEACRPIAKEALRFALTPVVNQMSVIGIISIPGMMTGAILGGSSVSQAARLQIAIMFMISSCTALSSIVTTLLTLIAVVDSQHRVRTDKIDARPHAVWRARDWAIAKALEGAGKVWDNVKGLVGFGRGDNGDDDGQDGLNGREGRREERRGLLASSSSSSS